jgi:putative PIN family toxin of toxin-antitoxin system
MDIVIDTNSLIDGSTDDYNFGSRIIDAVIAGKLNAFANHSTLAENRLIANRKISDTEYLEKLSQFFDSVNLVETKNRLNVVEDYEDNKILESAVESGSGFLVTSDHHLLKLEQYDNVKIISPAGFWQIYEEQTTAGWKNWISNFINS